MYYSTQSIPSQPCPHRLLPPPLPQRAWLATRPSVVMGAARPRAARRTPPPTWCLPPRPPRWCGSPGDPPEDVSLSFGHGWLTRPSWGRPRVSSSLSRRMAGAAAAGRATGMAAGEGVERISGLYSGRRGVFFWVFLCAGLACFSLVVDLVRLRRVALLPASFRKEPRSPVRGDSGAALQPQTKRTLARPTQPAFRCPTSRTSSPGSVRASWDRP